MSTLGIIGAGKVGSQIARAAASAPDLRYQRHISVICRCMVIAMTFTKIANQNRAGGHRPFLDPNTKPPNIDGFVSGLG